MEHIFHEKQEGSLCAQHCLNSLLQGQYFNAVTLSDIGRQLDDLERQHMAVGNVDSPEYLAFMQQPSSNYDDSGYFSIQVILKALDMWALQIVQYNSQAASEIRKDPLNELAYICNLSNHWLTIRKFGKQWFNLNSTKMCPELISDTYLSLFLAQLQEEGYSIFVVKGTLPNCIADTYFQNHTVTLSEFREFEDRFRKKPKARNEASKEQTIPVDTTPAKPVDAEDVRNKRLNYFLNKDQNSSTGESSSPISSNFAVENKPSIEEPSQTDTSELTEEEMLQIAMSMSMENS